MLGTTRRGDAVGPVGTTDPGARRSRYRSRPVRRGSGPGSPSIPSLQFGYRPGLDGLRGIAVLLVVLFHLGGTFWPWSRWHLHGAFVGVDLFFALSGFLITCLLLSEFDRSGRVDVPRFLYRRTVRLLPALAVAVVTVVVASIADLIPMRPRYAVESAVWTLGFTPSWPSGGHLLNPELGQTWSLAVEAQFYLVWCIALASVVALVRRHPRQVLFGLALAGTLAVAVNRAVQLRSGHSPVVLYLDPPYRLDGPLVGAMGGIAFASGWLDRVPQRLMAWSSAAALAAVAWVTVFAVQLDESLFQGGLTLIAVAATVLVAGTTTLQRGWLASFMRWGPLVRLGQMSYSVFLWHVGVFTVFQREATSWPLGLQAASALTVAAACSAASYHLVERPTMRRLGRRTIVVQAVELRTTPTNEPCRTG